MKGRLQEVSYKVAFKMAMSYLEGNPEENIPKLIGWVEKFDRHRVISYQLEAVKKVLADNSSSGYQLAKSLYTDIDPHVRKKLFENFIIYGNLIGSPQHIKNREKYGCNIPWAILFDPTSACNLKCIGCWAADYGAKMSMSYETLDDIVKQGKDLGIYFYALSGGEPLVRKKDVLRLCDKHNECVFMAFTNGTLIDEDFADEMLRVKNFVPAISIEGFRKETDARRGEGTYEKVVAAMQILKRKRLLFGASCCYTRENTEVLGSDAYFDHLIDLGAKFAWFFTYMPVGVNASPELLVTPEQRKYMYHKTRETRNTKPLFAIDFWNDGEYIDGCIAGGRRYLHINANGDIEPCAFIHYSDSSIYEKTLVEAFQSPLFMAYRKGQPFNQNHLRPCPLLDNGGRLAEMVKETGAKSTEALAPEDVDDLTAKCIPAAEKWQPVADQLWAQSQAKKAKGQEKDKAV